MDFRAGGLLSGAAESQVVVRGVSIAGNSMCVNSNIVLHNIVDSCNVSVKR